MCGICGILHFEKEQRVQRQQIEKMSDVISHRGPDASTLWAENNIGLGHRRLSIIDIEGGQQPMATDDGCVHLVYNGELYNYQGLKKTLLQRGHHFKTNSDTEVILRSWEEFGSACLEHFRGMFAFAIYDSREDVLFIARDRIGIKPLYYTVVNNTLYFGSEIKSLLVCPEVDRTLDNSALYCYLRLRYVPGPRTIFQKINKLAPGHYLSVKNGSIQTNCYWNPAEIAPRSKLEPLEDIQEEFDALIEESVKMRMMSEVPFGALLSGGLDSSVVTALMAKHNAGHPVKTFSVGYENGDDVNEFEYARKVANKWQTEHYECHISSSRFFDFIPRLVWHLDEPIADAACIPLYFLSEYARQHVTVVLSGEGADELLSGYGLYRKMLKLQGLDAIPASIREKAVSLAVSTFSPTGKIRRYLELLQSPREKRYKGISSAFQATDMEKHSSFYRPEYEKMLEDFFSTLWRKSDAGGSLNSMMHVDMNSWLPDDLLMKADKMTMAASQELRVPFLDHKLVEFAYSLPGKAKINNGETKFLLRQLGRTLLPEEIITRPKKGFPVPVSRWFEEDFHQVAQEVFTDTSSFIASLFDPEYLNSMFCTHNAAHNDSSETLWNLLVLEFWYRGIKAV